MNRREMLKSGGLVAGAMVVKAASQNSSGAALPSRKCKIVVTGGHPGDPEYACGGTIARLTAMGHEVVLLYLNDGAMGADFRSDADGGSEKSLRDFEGTAGLRRSEERARDYR